MSDQSGRPGAPQTPRFWVEFWPLLQAGLGVSWPPGGPKTPRFWWSFGHDSGPVLATGAAEHRSNGLVAGENRTGDHIPTTPERLQPFSRPSATKVAKIANWSFPGQ